MTELTQGMQRDLKRIVQEAEGLISQKAEIATELTELLKDAKENGFDTKVIRKVIKLRAMKESEREEAEMILDTYLRAVGFETSPLGEYGERASKKAAKAHLAVV